MYVPNWFFRMVEFFGHAFRPSLESVERIATSINSMPEPVDDWRVTSPPVGSKHSTSLLIQPVLVSNILTSIFWGVHTGGMFTEM